VNGSIALRGSLRAGQSVSAISVVRALFLISSTVLKVTGAGATDAMLADSSLMVGKH